ncbi:MAG: tetratricopeptide repeat protein, partial [bacterium]
MGDQSDNQNRSFAQLAENDNWAALIVVLLVAAGFLFLHYIASVNDYTYRETISIPKFQYLAGADFLLSGLIYFLILRKNQAASFTRKYLVGGVPMAAGVLILLFSVAGRWETRPIGKRDIMLVVANFSPLSRESVGEGEAVSTRITNKIHTPDIYKVRLSAESVIGKGEEARSRKARELVSKSRGHLLLWGEVSRKKGKTVVIPHITVGKRFFLTGKYKRTETKPRPEIIDPSQFTFSRGAGEAEIVKFVSAYSLYLQDRYQEAIDGFNRVRSLDPWSLFFIGNSYYYLEKIDLSVITYQRLLAKYPKFTEAFINWGTVLESQGEYDQAIEKYQLVLGADPGNVAALNNWGVLLNNNGFYAEAMEKFKQALEINPDYLPANLNLGLTWGSLGYHDDEIALYQGLARRFPGNAEILNRWAHALAEHKEYEAAVLKYQASLKINRYDERVYNNLGIIYGKLNRPEKR